MPLGPPIQPAQPSPHAQALPDSGASTDAALRIEGLRFRYDASGPWIVDIQHLDIARGEQVLLSGTSGCGKSTLLHLIAGLLEPSAGSVRVAGKRVHELRPAQRDLFRGGHIGMVFQTFNLLAGFSAAENVMLAMLFGDRPRSEHHARATGLLHHLGVERVAALVEQLSVGQQQRVAVARALACSPALVLADEPTASLDPDNARVALELLQSACREHGAALLCVSHDPTLAGRFDRTLSFAQLRAPTHAP